MFSPRIFAILVFITGCAAPRANAPTGAPKGLVNTPQSGSPFPDGKSGRVRSRALDFPLELVLPDRASWRITDGPTWLEAEHVASSSKFALRTWRAERLVRRSDCASQARLARQSIPIVQDESVLDRRAFTAPQGFDSELVVGVEPSARGVLGYAIVFGASVGYCYAAVFTTTASGGDAEQEVATRLGVAVDRILSGVRTRSVDERAVRHRLVVGSKATPSAAPSETK